MSNNQYSDGARTEQTDTVITPKSIQDHAATWIRDRILRGEFSIGERLVEGELAERIGVSRVPVRAALQQLVAEGLVDHIPRIGRFTHVPSLQEVEDVQQVRSMLEGLAARRLALKTAIAKDKSPGLDALEKLNEQMRVALDAGDLTTYFSFSRQFHEKLIALSESDTLMKVHEFLMNRAALFRQLSGGMSERQVQAINEHVAIVEAIRKGEPDEAERLTKYHTLNGMKSMQKALRERGLVK